ncbi:heavy metal-responsive transcriptional regulator [Massilia phosphatilytica]|jgi:DNA-binding transcriptional MerR regulator|nr:heavy metal-responsive transcriptional regulator [Massilia phosphatilytica]
MRIGEIAQRAGVSRDTVRFYERLGLLEEVSRPHSTNTYKAYSTTALRRIELISHAKKLGFTLREITEVIQAWEQNDLAVDAKKALIQEKIAQVDQKAESLATIRASLVDALGKVESGCHDE